MKDEILKFVNKEKLATGVIAEASNKIGIKPMYLRTSLAVTTAFNPLLGAAIYGAGFAYKKFKK